MAPGTLNSILKQAQLKKLKRICMKLLKCISRDYWKIN
ncbi:MAG: hypothetical protein OIN86_14430 [Candidatus Methanoperedens sp.]|nr:hypothetical protein [Candidatus Methanoperedens sp.]